MGKIKALIFDLGDTLIYFDGVWLDVLDQANLELAKSLKAAGLVFEDGMFLELFRDRMEEYYRARDTEFIEYTTFYVLSQVLEQIGLGMTPERIIRKCMEDMYAVFQSHWVVDPEAIETLQALKQRGFILGMVSNTADDANVQYLVDKIQVRSFFDRIVTSAALGIRKPNPRIFLPILDHWKIPPEQVAMVGDTLGADILGARNAGLFSIWVTRHAESAGNRAHRDTIHPDAVIESLKDLPGLLDLISD